MSQMESDALLQTKERLAEQMAVESANHHSHAEEVDEMWKWIKISFVVALPICALSAVKDILFEEHPHPHEGAEPDYMHIRNKPFPWECEDCDLFDMACWKKCKADKALGE